MINYKIIIYFLLLFLFITTIDIIYLTLNKKIYLEMIYSIQNKPLKKNIVAGTFVYIILTLSIMLIIHPIVYNIIKEDVNKNEFLLTLFYSFIISLCSYGVFNFTNIAIFEDYKFNVSIIDIIWGTTLIFLSSLFYMFIILKKF